MFSEFIKWRRRSTLKRLFEHYLQERSRERPESVCLLHRQL